METHISVDYTHIYKIILGEILTEILSIIYWQFFPSNPRLITTAVLYYSTSTSMFCGICEPILLLKIILLIHIDSIENKLTTILIFNT